MALDGKGRKLFVEYDSRWPSTIHNVHRNFSVPISRVRNLSF